MFVDESYIAGPRWISRVLVHLGESCPTEGLDMVTWSAWFLSYGGVLKWRIPKSAWVSMLSDGLGGTAWYLFMFYTLLNHGIPVHIFIVIYHIMIKHIMDIIWYIYKYISCHYRAHPIYTQWYNLQVYTYIYIYMHQALPPPPSPPWDGSHILPPYEIFPLPPVVWWGCVWYVGYVWCVWSVWYACLEVW